MRISAGTSPGSIRSIWLALERQPASTSYSEDRHEENILLRLPDGASGDRRIGTGAPEARSPKPGARGRRPLAAVGRLLAACRPRGRSAGLRRAAPAIAGRNADDEERRQGGPRADRHREWRAAAADGGDVPRLAARRAVS